MGSTPLCHTLGPAAFAGSGEVGGVYVLGGASAGGGASPPFLVRHSVINARVLNTQFGTVILIECLVGEFSHL